MIYIGVEVFGSDPKFRKTGVAQTLFEFTESKAREEGCRLIWSIPRKSALPAYTKFGFRNCRRLL